MKINSNAGFSIDSGDNTPSFSLPPVMVGESGVIIEANNISFVFSQEAADSIFSLPPTSRGIFIDDATIHLPKDISVALPSDIHLDDLFIGNGGFYGKVAGNWTPQLSSDGKSFSGNGAGNICGIPFGLKSISLEFIQNSFVESSLHGTMILPFFDGPIDVEICLANDGDFAVNISSSDDGSLIKLTKADLLELSLLNIGFAYQDNLFSITLGGKIKPLIGNLDWPEVDIKALTIDSDGNVKIDGGWIEIPKQASLDFNGFVLELTKIGFGKEDDGSKWIGLSGAVTIVDAIPMRGGVEGLKLIWTADNRFRMEIGGISVAFEIEDILSFNGKVFFIDEPAVKGFKGGIKIVFHALNGMSLDGQFIAGKKLDSPKFNFFYMFVAVDLPVGIPLGATGAALFGFKGLGGVNVKPNKLDTENWFENDDGSDGFYLKHPVGITDVEKWTYEKDNYAFGAGLVLGTASDNGYTFSGSVLLIVLIPGPVILIEGKGNFLKDRSQLNDDPFLRMLAVIDGRAGTLLFNCAAQYKYKDDGSVISVSGGTEVFFNFNNPNDWHLYLGQKSPESKRIKARILKLLDANTYLMIDSNKFEMGVWAGFKKNWKFGPLRVKVSAWLQSILGMSFEPVQAWASITMSGEVKLTAFGKGIGLSVYTHLACTTPNPWYLGGEFKVKLNLPWPLPDPKATIKLEWKNNAAPPIPIAIADLGVEHLKVSEKWMLGDSTIEQSPVVPLDARPVINFAKAVEDSILMGGSDINNPEPETVDKYKYKYKLVKVKLSKKSKIEPSVWTTVSEKNINGNFNEENFYGEWLVSPGASSAEKATFKPSNTKLMLWANTPFDITRDIDNNYSMIYQLMDLRHESYPCHQKTQLEMTCTDFRLLNESEYAPVLFHEDLTFFCAHYKILIKNEKVTETYLCLSDLYVKKENQDFFKIQILPIIDKLDSMNTKHKGPLLIISPEERGFVSLFFLQKWTGSIYIINRNQEIIDSIESNGDYLDESYKFQQKHISAIVLYGNFKLLKICSASMEEVEAFEFKKLTAKYKKNTVEKTWGEHLGAILDPMHYYKLQVETQTMRKKGNGSWQTWNHDKAAYFQTENPPGCFIPSSPHLYSTGSVESEEAELDNIDRTQYPHGGALTDLSVYIKETIPQQVSSNEVQVPFYRSYDVGVKFNVSNKHFETAGYIERMYLMADLPLSIHLLDNNNNPVSDKNGDELILDNPWGKNIETNLTREEKQWGRILNSNCEYEIILEEEQYAEELLAKSKELVLGAKTLYKARVMAGNLYTVYEFSFITSQFSSFIHHIHSFSNKLWDFHKLENNSAIDTTGLNGSIGNKDFEELNLIFGLGIRDYPDDFEILLLNDENNTYGLLLESPEPIDWNRVTTEFFHKGSDEEITECLSDVKLIDAQLQGSESENFNNEYIDILIKEKNDLSGCTVLCKKTDEQDFSIYYTFGENEIFQTGAIIRIHSGKESEYESSEIEHLFKTDPEGVAKSVFDADIVAIKINDKSGILLHEHSFMKYSIAERINKNRYSIVHNQDYTKSFLFIEDNNNIYSSFEEGRYKLSFIFKRKMTGAMELKRLGSSLHPEKTYIEFEI